MIKAQAAAVATFLPVWETQGLEERDSAVQSCWCVSPQDFVPALELSWKAQFLMDKDSFTTIMMLVVESGIEVS